MTADADPFGWMRGHRAPPPVCSVCGGLFINRGEHPDRYYSGDGSAVCPDCIALAIGEAILPDVLMRSIRRRLASLRHQCPAEGCPTCQETGR